MISSGFDAHTANLHLIIKTTEDFQCAVRTKTACVAGVVNQIERIVAKRVLHKPLSLFLRGIDVTECAERCSYDDLSGFPNTTRLPVLIPNQRLGLWKRPADQL